jgi:Zn-finger nucleic acid-binding protein
MTVTHWLDGAGNACGANLQQFGHSSREYVTCPKCRRVIDSQVAAGQQV